MRGRGFVESGEAVKEPAVTTEERLEKVEWELGRANRRTRWGDGALE